MVKSGLFDMPLGPAAFQGARLLYRGGRFAFVMPFPKKRQFENEKPRGWRGAFGQDADGVRQIT